MRTLTFSRLCLIGAFVLGLMVLWAAAAPHHVTASSLVGGDWYPTTCDKCSDQREDVCPKGRLWLPDGPLLDCGGPGLTTCKVGGSLTCSKDSAEPVCNDNGGQGSEICNGIYDAKCE